MIFSKTYVQKVVKSNELKTSMIVEINAFPYGMTYDRLELKYSWHIFEVSFHILNTNDL